MIASFRDADAERLFRSGNSRRLPAKLRRAAARKLGWLHGAHDLNDLRIPPGNRLEALRGDRQGQHSIRINDQYRICFVWRDGNAYEVEIVDYH
ncbi:MAG: type II toxin-antitoxin system RelE/ParE family toxin [Terriglobales bacterium]